MADLTKRLADALREARDTILQDHDPADRSALPTNRLLNRIDALLAEAAQPASEAPEGLFAAMARTDEARAILLFHTAEQANAYVEALKPLLAAAPTPPGSPGEPKTSV